jgi:hypothetical protein
VLFVFVELGHPVDFVHLAVHAHAHKALRLQLVEQFQIFALAPDDQRRDDHQPGFFR